MTLENKNRNYLASAFTGLLWVLFIKLFWPSFIPFSFWGLWDGRGDLGAWLTVGLPIFVWGAAVNVFFLTVRSPIRRRRWAWDRGPSAIGVFFLGLGMSVWAGVVEEICFRWLIFLSAIATIKIVNFLFFGWLGFGLAQWLHLHIFGVLADVVTLHHLHEYLFSSKGWAVGAAMLSANAFFRDGHKYQGWFGTLNAWFLGMFLFWVAFHYGLLAAIVVHFTYDFIIFTIEAVAVALS